MSLLPDVKASYTAIIDGILHVSNLKTVSAKQIRKGLQSALGFDIDSQKDAVNELIMARFDEVESMKNTAVAIASTTKSRFANDQPQLKCSAPHVNPGRRMTQEQYSDKATERDGIDQPPIKKHRSTPDEDAAFAARLQAEENSRARLTRGSGSSKRQTINKPTKKRIKSASRITSVDGDILDSVTDIEKSVNRSGAFHKPMTLSLPLSDLLGETTLSRPQTVKRIWEYVKQHELQNPDDKRQILCDEPMRAVFKQDTVHMFTMNKILSKHLYPEDD